jgi:hypothetical protein
MAGCALATACSSTDSRPTPTPAPSPSVTALPAPTDYTSACRVERQVCEAGAALPDAFPAELQRPLRLPVVGRGQPCPVTPGTAISNGALGGVALGTGPVRPVVGSGLDPAKGIPLGLQPTGGFLGFKTLWYAEPTYDGPALIRGARLDAPGEVGFGEGPQAAALVIPPGATVNDIAGIREAPGGTWLRSPGCYAWQVDGVGFSTVIVFLAIRG